MAYKTIKEAMDSEAGKLEFERLKEKMKTLFIMCPETENRLRKMVFENLNRAAKTKPNKG